MLAKQRKVTGVKALRIKVSLRPAFFLVNALIPINFASVFDALK
jgi:hypothetical protein